MTTLDEEWLEFMNDETCIVKSNNDSILYESDKVPECEKLYISTKTKVLFLNQKIDIDNVFWKLKVLPYHYLENCIIKKQIKIVSTSQEEFEDYQKKLKDIPYYKENIIKQINNPSARRIKFKDERKITVGLSKKDILNFRGKIKNAFYNCFAIIIRYSEQNNFKEVHVKVFNTGKLEIPGIVDSETLEVVKNILVDNIQPFLNEKIEFIDSNDENVLINSNFNCGFYINRSKLTDILNDKYKIETAFDPCSYPGVKCKFYFNNEKPYCINEQNGIIDEENLKMSDLNDSIKYTVISIMIFRTGSCLIVGNCNEKTLNFVFNYIKNLFSEEYLNIRAPSEIPANKNKETKIKKRKIYLTNDYYEKLTNKRNLL
jgi:hypothetical protein